MGLRQSLTTEQSLDSTITAEDKALYKHAKKIQEILKGLGQKSYPDLKSIPVPIDVVDIFRAPAACDAIVEEVIEVGAKAVWFQLGVINRNAANAAKDAGLTTIMDCCMKIEHGRYNGSLHLVGMNTGLISARRAKVGF